MFVQSKASTRYDQKNGLCVRERKGGKEILIQWPSGRQEWHRREDIEGRIELLERPKSKMPSDYIDFFGERD